MSRKAFTCLLAAIVPWLLAMAGSAAADETFKPTTIITVPGGLKSFDIGFVDADIHTYVVADRTNKSIDVVDTRTNTLRQLTATPPFAGVRANPGAASGPDGTLIVDHKEVWAGDAPSSCTTSAPFVCSPDSSRAWKTARPTMSTAATAMSERRSWGRSENARQSVPAAQPTDNASHGATKSA